jgi:hypothetical protein
MKIRGPVLDQRRQGIRLSLECRNVPADAEQLALRGYQHGANVFAHAQFGHSKAELAAKDTVHGIAPIGLVENDMSEAIFDFTEKTRRRRRQTHLQLPRLSIVQSIGRHGSHKEANRSSG